MRIIFYWTVATALILGAILVSVRRAHAAEPVDVALVIAMDVSGSIDEGEYAMQKDGTARALRSDRVGNAIVNGPIGAVAITVVEWSGHDHQRVIVPWHRLSTRAEIDAFADALQDAPRAFSDFTGVGEAILFSAGLLDACPYETGRHVIDVSGDGMNNAGISADEGRDAATAKGYVVNGLPILTDDATLDAWYTDHVSGGPGSFVIPTKDFSGFFSALTKKLTIEISGSLPFYASR